MKDATAEVSKVGELWIDGINKKSRGVGGQSYIEQQDHGELCSNVFWNILEL